MKHTPGMWVYSSLVVTAQESAGSKKKNNNKMCHDLALSKNKYIRTLSLHLKWVQNEYKGSAVSCEKCMQTRSWHMQPGMAESCWIPAAPPHRTISECEEEDESSTQHGEAAASCHPTHTMFAIILKSPVGSRAVTFPYWSLLPCHEVGTDQEVLDVSRLQQRSCKVANLGTRFSTQQSSLQREDSI